MPGLDVSLDKKVINKPIIYKIIFTKNQILSQQIKKRMMDYFTWFYSYLSYNILFNIIYSIIHVSELSFASYYFFKHFPLAFKTAEWVSKTHAVSFAKIMATKIKCEYERDGIKQITQLEREYRLDDNQDGNHPANEMQSTIIPICMSFHKTWVFGLHHNMLWVVMIV